MTAILNIATMPIADKVQRYMMASLYALQLEALQKEATRLDYHFCRAESGVAIPAGLLERLAYAVEYKRKSYLYPHQTSEFWVWNTRQSMGDGYAQEFVQSMLAALAALGVRLQEGSHAHSLLAAEECDQLFEKIGFKEAKR